MIFREGIEIMSGCQGSKGGNIVNVYRLFLISANRNLISYFNLISFALDTMLKNIQCLWIHNKINIINIYKSKSKRRIIFFRLTKLEINYLQKVNSTNVA